MKKTIITILTVVIILMVPNISSAVELKGGFKVGINFADFYGEDMKEIEEGFGEKLEAKLGLCVGGFITFILSDMIAIQPEVLYSMKGSKAEGTIFNETFKLQYNFHYWEIPVLVKLQIPTQGNVKPNIFLGPCVSIKLSGQAKVEYAGETGEEDIKNIKDNDFGLIIGAGIDFGKLIIDLRYNLGLSSIYTEDLIDIKNRVISLMVGYSF